jgi:hypothetical protein
VRKAAMLENNLGLTIGSNANFQPHLATEIDE